MRELRAELNFYYKRFDNSSAAEAEKFKTDINRIETKLANTTRQINSLRLAKSNGQRNQIESFSLRKLQTQLSGSTTLIEFVEFNGAISAFVISGTKIRYVGGLTTSDEMGRLLDELHFQFGALRYGSVQLGRFLDDLKGRADKCLKKLYDRLLRPLEPYLSGRQLIIIPVGTLNYVPFHALHDGREYAVQHFEISRAQAPPSGIICRTRGEGNKKLAAYRPCGRADTSCRE